MSDKIHFHSINKCCAQLILAATASSLCVQLGCKLRAIRLLKGASSPLTFFVLSLLTRGLLFLEHFIENEVKGKAKHGSRKFKNLLTGFGLTFFSLLYARGVQYGFRMEALKKIHGPMQKGLLTAGLISMAVARLGLLMTTKKGANPLGPKRDEPEEDSRVLFQKYQKAPFELLFHKEFFSHYAKLKEAIVEHAHWQQSKRLQESLETRYYFLKSYKNALSSNNSDQTRQDILKLIELGEASFPSDLDQSIGSEEELQALKEKLKRVTEES